MVKNRLAEIIEERGIKNVWLAEKANLNNSTIGNIIKNRHNPNVEVALKIANALNLKVEEIWYLDDL
jgi:DNA-binding XRE family transcriptional regulator